MTRNKVNFKFTKDFGSTQKGSRKVLKRPFALRLQDQRKVGKIVKPEKSGKAVKPKQDKAEPKARTRQTK